MYEDYISAYKKKKYIKLTHYLVFAKTRLYISKKANYV